MGCVHYWGCHYQRIDNLNKSLGWKNWPSSWRGVTSNSCHQTLSPSEGNLTLRNLAARKIAPAAMWWGLNCKQSDVRSLHSSSNVSLHHWKEQDTGKKTEEAGGGDTILSETKIGPLFPLARQILTLPHTQVCITSYLCKRTRVQVGQLMLPSTAFKFEGTVETWSKW